MPSFAAKAARSNQAIIRHFGQVVSFAATGYSASVPVVFQLMQSQGNLAGQSTGFDGVKLQLLDSDYDPKMTGATVAIDGIAYKVQSADPQPVDGMRILSLRQGAL
jgi:hypothetical protein